MSDQIQNGKALSSDTFGSRVAAFYAALRFVGSLPENVEILNPYTNAETLECVRAFCGRYYADNTPRLACFGINPGRFGGGLTGLSFTDPPTLREICGIPNNLGFKRELSAEFVWSVVEAFGGADVFFRRIFLTALCPLGFVKNGVNYNFYDDASLLQSTEPFMVQSVRAHLAFGVRTDVSVCFGTGKLQTAFEALNRRGGFFGRIVALEHPRFIMQYRRKRLEEYRQKYVETLLSAIG